MTTAPKKFRLRHFFERYPFFDGLRLKVLSWLCHKGMAFIDSSYDVQKVFSKASEQYLGSGAPAAFAIFHQQMAGILHLCDDFSKVTILVSESRDGEIVARALAALGLTLVRGSPARGAIKATRQLVREARRGQHLAITVDGPRGPIYDVKPGIIKIAQMTGLPIIPTVSSAKFKKLMRGWDKFMIPTWGSSMMCLYGDPIYVSRKATEAELADIRDHLDHTMSTMRLEAESFWSCQR